MAGPTKRDKNNFQNAKNRFFQLLDDAKYVTDTPCMVDTDNLRCGSSHINFMLNTPLSFRRLVSQKHCRLATRDLTADEIRSLDPRPNRQTPRKFTWVQIPRTAHLRHKGIPVSTSSDEEDEETGESDIAMDDEDHADGSRANTEQSSMEDAEEQPEDNEREQGDIPSLDQAPTSPHAS
ncbi:hypothetical protein HMN09_01411300 [Mycena chlorophos]|uniref:Uncharacterized protein n=1 Tax=Mycena chlorophos TaxID=658473 RepID=A0A8H6RXM9_MYCCL|nr:hypothetical protein HMN09_01411300 [Mycena chlorophos]